jgi:hypothetical protein
MGTAKSNEMNEFQVREQHAKLNVQSIRSGFREILINAFDDLTRSSYDREQLFSLGEV